MRDRTGTGDMDEVYPLDGGDASQSILRTGLSPTVPSVEEEDGRMEVEATSQFTSPRADDLSSSEGEHDHTQAVSGGTDPMQMMASILLQMQLNQDREHKEGKKRRKEERRQAKEDREERLLNESNLRIRERNRERVERLRRAGKAEALAAMAQAKIGEEARIAQARLEADVKANLLETKRRKETEARDREEREFTLTLLEGQRTERRKAPVYIRMTDDVDLEAYLEAFQDHLETHLVPKVNWSQALVPLMNAEVTDLYNSLERVVRQEFAELSKAILTAFHVTPENHRRKLNSMTKVEGQTWPKFAVAINKVGRRWLRQYQTRDDVVNGVLQEILLGQMPGYLAGVVREKGPSTIQEAGQLAATYLDNHPRREASKNPVPQSYREKPKYSKEGERRPGGYFGGNREQVHQSGSNPERL